jgi:hypothetical protein
MISKSFRKETQVFAGQTLGRLKGEMILFTMKEDNTSVGCTGGKRPLIPVCNYH